MVGKLAIGKSVEFRLNRAQEFLDIYFNNGGMGGVLVHLSAGVSVGDTCRLEFHFLRDDTDDVVFHSRGIARWNRPTAARGLPAGIGVEFLEGERETRDLLLDHAQGRQVHITSRRSRRFPVAVVVEYATDSVFLTDVTDDLSAEGCFLVSDSLLPPGSELKLTLKPPGERRGISLAAHVVWVRDEGLVGMGIEFARPGWSSRRRLKDLLAHIRQQGGMPRPAD